MRGIKTVRKKQGVIIHCILKVATMMSKENEAQLQLEPKGLVFGCLQRPPYSEHLIARSFLPFS